MIDSESNELKDLEELMGNMVLNNEDGQELNNDSTFGGAHGSNCNELYLLKGIAVDMAMLRRISKGVLSNLDLLHEKDIVHKNVCASNVYINNQGDIQLSNVSVELVTHSTSTHQYSKETDIFKFGICILSLTLGTCVDENEIVIPENIAMDLKDFIEKCLLKEEDRYTSIQLREHPFLKDQLSEANLNVKSRVDVEFEVLGSIGKGGFGKVFKVRNKLDERVYALKSIELNSNDKFVNENIAREVKLLSGLKHDNVVRYYNSWTETAIVSDDEDESDEDNDYSSIYRSTIVVHCDSHTNNKNVDEEDISEDSYIQFEQDNPISICKELDYSNAHSSESRKNQNTFREIQILYIQMEFAKSTLRAAIDSDLYLDNERVWRLFGEIIEGLAYIHQQEMIHRDLKPANMFLDADDHVKIGDFGLATSIETYIEKSSQRGSGYPYSLTGNIGTALYAAPELKTDMERTKTTYNQKVDLYSLGIIFFEMCYKPCTTQCERAEIISKLRLNDIIFPQDFKEKTMKVKVIKKLLNHNPDNRPTSQKLFELFVEKRKVCEIIGQTLKSPEQSTYKYLINSCLNQPSRHLRVDLSDKVPFSLGRLKFFNYVRDMIVDVFKRHGGHELSIPFLMPNNNNDDFETNVKLMTHSGGIVTIPQNLRVPFAKFAVLNNITSLRRYSVERVYKEKRNNRFLQSDFGFIEVDSCFMPIESYECAFDIITSTPSCEDQTEMRNLTTDLEVIAVLNDIATTVPAYQEKKLYVRLSHMTLLNEIFVICDLQGNHVEIFNFLNGIGSIFLLLQHIKMNEDSLESISNLFDIFIYEKSIRQLYKELLSFARERNTVLTLAFIHTFQYLKLIVDKAESSGIKIVIDLSHASTFGGPRYSGMLCQLVCGCDEQLPWRRPILASGGRYDELLNNYRSKLLQANKEYQQSAVGVSIYMDQFLQTFTKHDIDNIPDLQLNDQADIL